MLFATAACNFWTSEQMAPNTMFCTFSRPNLRFATAACIFSTSELQKVLQTPHVLYIFTSTFAFGHSGVQFFDIRTSKSAPNTSCFVHYHFHMCFSPQRRAFFQHLNFKKSAPTMRCFEHFHFHMCFSPQRRAIFRHRNFKKCAENDVFCTLSFPNVRFAKAAYNFCCLLSAPTSAPAALTGLLFD